MLFIGGLYLVIVVCTYSVPEADQGMFLWLLDPDPDPIVGTRYGFGSRSRFFLSMYVIQHYFICRPSDSTVSEDAGMTVATYRYALTARRSSHSARSHPHFG
jgi:hypothetical protein